MPEVCAQHSESLTSQETNERIEDVERDDGGGMGWVRRGSFEPVETTDLDVEACEGSNIRRGK